MDTAPRNAARADRPKIRFDPPSNFEFGIVVRNETVLFCGNVEVDGFKDKHFWTRNPVKEVNWFCDPVQFDVDANGYIVRVHIEGIDVGCPIVEFYKAIEHF